MKAQKLALALAVSLGGGLWASLPITVLAVGNVDTASGEASVASPGGKPRAIAKGDRIVEGDTIVTGANGAVLITTDDSGVLAVRPRSRLTIDAYKVNGNDQDSVVLNLLRGSLRSITGWISKTAPKNYKITTSTATVGIRGTDHEVAVGEAVEGSKDDSEGTWNQVTEGATTLATRAGELAQQAGTPSATGRVKTAGLAPVQAAPPPALFKPQAQDARTTELKKDAQTNQQQRLDTRKAQVVAAGGTTAQGGTQVSTQCAPNAPAQKALDDLIRAYEQGDIAFLQQHLSPSMVGYGALINDIQTSTVAQRQTRIQIKDRQMQCGPDVASITFSWEKTFLDAVSFQPGIVRGTGSVLLTGLNGGQWQVGGLAGSSPFASAGNAPSTDGTITVSQPSIDFSNNPSGCTQALVSVNVSALLSGGLGPFYSPAPYTTPSTVCTVTPVTAGANSCLFNITSSSGAVLGTVPGTYAPPNPALTTCNRVYSGSPIPAGQSIGSSQIGLSVLATVSAVSGPGGSTVQLNRPVVLVGTRPVSLGSITASDNVQTVPGNCSAMAYTLPAATPGAPLTCSAVPSVLNVAIEVRDADVTTPSLQVTVGASNGDTETLVLPRVSAGVYRLNALPITRGGASTVPGNGRIDIGLGSANATISLVIKYNDARSTTGVNIVREVTLQLLGGI